ncbi:MAG: flagellar FlbD family protein [Armatimonadetes bacterium]|nr:flagellar FlbD family protein [Armatimonadota bacterium]
MITLTRLNGTRICVNAFLIEHLEETPDTVVSLTNGHHFLVRESIEEIVNAAVSYLGCLRDQGVDPVAVGQMGRTQEAVRVAPASGMSV